LSLTSYDRLFPNQDTLPKGRIRQPDRAPLAKKSPASKEEACLWMINSFPLPINGHFLPHGNHWLLRNWKGVLSVQARAAARLT